MSSRQFWLTVLAVVVAQLAGGAVAYLATRGIRGVNGGKVPAGS